MHLREEEFRSLFSMADFLEAGHRAFQLYGQKEVDNPPRAEKAEAGYFRLEMAAQWSDKYRVRKVIEEHSDTHQGQLGERQTIIHLQDLQRGTEVSLDADYITDMRTGAAAALGLKYLAPKSVTRLGVLGTGRVAGALVVAADQLFDLEEIRVTSRRAENRARFAQQVGPQLTAPLQLATSKEACIDGVDSLALAVPTPEPILTLDEVGDNMVLATMGGDGRTRQLAPQVLEQVGVVVDAAEQAAKSGEFSYAEKCGRQAHIAFARDAAGQVLNIGDAACGRLLGANPLPRIAYFTGLAVQDLCAAVMVYERVVLES